MLTGGCFCGAVRYETAAKPFHPTLCHCESCRRIAGAVPVGWFSVARGDLAFIAARPAIFRSSPGVSRGFCAVCGTCLTYESADFPGEIDVTIGSLDDPEQVPAADHTHLLAKPSWLRVNEDLPAYPYARPRPRG